MKIDYGYPSMADRGDVTVRDLLHVASTPTLLSDLSRLKLFPFWDCTTIKWFLFLGGGGTIVHFPRDPLRRIRIGPFFHVCTLGGGEEPNVLVITLQNPSLSLFFFLLWSFFKFVFHYCSTFVTLSPCKVHPIHKAFCPCHHTCKRIGFIQKVTNLCETLNSLAVTDIRETGRPVTEHSLNFSYCILNCNCDSGIYH